MPDFDVIGVGALNVDRIYAVPKFVRDGAQIVLASSVAAGGSSANTVYALGKLGLKCGFVGVIGDDPDGRLITQSFAEVGVDGARIVTKQDRPTGRVLCLADGKGNRAMYVEAGASELLTHEDVDVSYLASARLVHLSSFAGDMPSVVQMGLSRELPPETRVTLSLDALYARRGLAILGGLIGRCDVLFANQEEVERVAVAPLREAVKACLETGCRAVVVTFGKGLRPERWKTILPAPRGGTGGDAGSVSVAAYVVTRDGEWTVPALGTHRTEALVTLGAGDAFAAGFLWGLLSGWELARCAALGHTAAGFCVTEMSARAGLPTLDQLLAHYRWHFR